MRAITRRLSFFFENGGPENKRKRGAGTAEKEILAARLQGGVGGGRIDSRLPGSCEILRYYYCFESGWNAAQELSLVYELGV